MQSIERLASETRVLLGIPDDERPDLLDLLRRLRMRGVISDFRSAGENELGKADARWVREDKLILVSDRIWDRLEDAQEGDVRFTVYHEVGHAVLNHPTRNRMPDGRLQFGRDIERHELEADDFALAFGIPLNIPTDPFDLGLLVKQFGLTELMTSRRMHALQKGIRPSRALPWKDFSMVEPTTDDDWNF